MQKGTLRVPEGTLYSQASLEALRRACPDAANDDGVIRAGLRRILREDATAHDVSGVLALVPVASHFLSFFKPKPLLSRLGLCGAHS